MASFVEVKMVSSTFMKIQDKLPEAKLTPSELVVLNNSAIVNYSKIAQKHNLPIYIVFIVANRPCITRNDDYKLYYQNFDVIYDIYKQKKKNKDPIQEELYKVIKTIKALKYKNPLFKVHLVSMN